MQSGYLTLEARNDDPGLIFVISQTSLPDLAQPALLYVAFFNDIDAAGMHFHEAVRRRLKSLEPRTYRLQPLEAVAAADAIELEHRRVFLSPSLAEDGRLAMDVQVLHQRHQRNDRWLDAVGWLALAFLVGWQFLNKLPV
jgi:hypothetical protein